MNEKAVVIELKEEEVSFAKKVWNQLSSVDCSKFTNEKTGFTYLSWSNAWDILMQNYPESEFTIQPEDRLEDGSVMTNCEVLVQEGENVLTRQMFLAVMDHRHNAIKGPSTRQIADTRVRCLVKTISLFGLGLYLYQGEDIPRDEDAVTVHRWKAGEKEEIVVQVMKCLENDDALGIHEIMDDYDDPSVKIKLWHLFDSTTRASLKKLLAETPAEE